MRKPILALMLAALAGPLVAQTSPPISNDLTVDMSPQQYRICNDRPARPTWMDEINPREAYKALTVMRLYELRAWQEIKASGDCGCDVRFPSWESASAEYKERFSTLSQAEHTQAQLALRNQQNLLSSEVRSICEAQGNW
ncbi:hypothetical protein [Phaeobacter italicus]|jgi:hypothetical protein|uniref:hypothetical protein n=1 Tax=Phaeobacter italicus TaxID=481446 RepID=UPI002FD9F4A5